MSMGAGPTGVRPLCPWYGTRGQEGIMNRTLFWTLVAMVTGTMLVVVITAQVSR